MRRLGLWGLHGIVHGPIALIFLLITSSCSHDYIAELHAAKTGHKFKSFRDWSGAKYQFFMDQIINYANYLKEQRNEEVQEEEKPSAPVLFTSGPGELPVLPAPVHGARSTEIARHAKEIIRAYFLRHYRM